MRMPTATIRENAWADASEPNEDRLAGRICIAPRFRPAFVAAELALCACLFALHPFRSQDSRIDMRIVAVWAVLAAALPMVLRLTLPRFASRSPLAERILAERVLIVGGGELAIKLSRIAASGWSRATVSNRIGPVSLPGAAIAIDLARLEEMLERGRVSRIIVAEQNLEQRKALVKALLDPRLQRVRVDEAVELYERFSQKVWVERLDSEWFVYAGAVHRSTVSLTIKRVLDIVFALLLIILAAPLMAIIAVAIRLNSRGPVLFRQLRVGLHGKTFFMFKFRSMYENAEHQTGPVWASAGDRRVTPIGRILRGFRLDEIPQAFNVLRGEMSMVGPRPERPYFVDELAKQIPFYTFRHRVKPGITGWAQVMYRYGDSFEDALEKLKYDFYYAEHGSFLCDLRILVKTFKIVLQGGGR